ncbi:MAG: HEAT repeat domain-containing protein [Deltaproteobacteria bacterium]|nr:HEAT repeat domain-containing protein [Deltaproteobacteria bacterium]
MKKILFLVIAGICFLTLSCQRSQPPEAKKEVQVQKEEIKQPPLVESKSLDQTKREVKESIPQEPKKEEKETSLAKQPSPLTEEEQKIVDEIGENILIAPTKYFESQEDAVPYLKVLLKGDHRNIKLYKGFEALGEDKRKEDYDEAMSKAVMALNPRTKEGKQLIIEVLRTKREYQSTLSEAARAVRASQDKSIIPLLREVLKSSATRVRLEAAGSLLALGDADTALPVLDELTREGATSALGFIFHNMQGKEWEQRGIALIKKALTYENNESRALAALFLIGLTQRRVIKEDIRGIEDILINISKDILEKKSWPITSHGYSDHRALETVILAFWELKSKKAIPVLRSISEHPEASYLKRRAEEAIKYLSKQGGA